MSTAHKATQGVHPSLHPGVDLYATFSIFPPLPRLRGSGILSSRFSRTCAALLCALIAVPTAAQSSTVDRSKESEWSVSDDTDNNTGERKVYAFQMYFPSDEPGVITLSMRCFDGKPTFFVEWGRHPFPDKTVVSIGGIPNGQGEPLEKQYIFQRSDDPIDRGLRASPETSAEIVSAIGDTDYITIKAHLPSGTRAIGADVSGTQRAWSRVARHCPVRKTALPPL